MSRMPLHLFAHPEDLAIVRLAPDEEPALLGVPGRFRCSLAAIARPRS